MAATDTPLRTEAEITARVKALEALLIEKGVMTTAAVDRMAEIYENEVGPQLGAKVVARAWTDPEFKVRLLEDATAACAEMGIGGLQGEEMIVVENTDTVHNVIVCTLCSCYPWPVLGLPPNWYKIPQYRSRIVRDPRGVLAEDTSRPDRGFTRLDHLTPRRRRPDYRTASRSRYTGEPVARRRPAVNRAAIGQRSPC